MEKVAVYIRRDLYERAEAYVKELGGFKDVGEFIEFLLEEALAASEGGAEAITREDEEKIAQRLKDLGYM